MKQDKNIEKSMFLYPVNLVNPRLHFSRAGCQKFISDKV